jgi:hypothetical protein
MSDTVRITHEGEVYNIPKELEEKFMTSHNGAVVETTKQRHPSKENHLKSAAIGFERAMASPGAGLMQLIGQPESAKFIHDYWEDAYRKSKEANPLTAMAGYGAGVLTPSVAIPFGGPASFLGRSALGAGIGGGMGFIDYAPEGESRLANTLMGAGEGGASANIIPGAMGLWKGASAIPGKIAKVSNFTKDLAKRKYEKYFGEYVHPPEELAKYEKMTKEYLGSHGEKPAKQLADEIAHEDLKALKTEGNRRYNELFNNAEKAGITKAELNEKDLLSDVRELFIGKVASEKQLRRIPEAIQTKNLRTIQQAKSDLDKFIHKTTKIDNKQGLLAAETDSLEAAKRLRAKLEDSLKNALRKAGGEKEVKAFEDANKHWVKVLENKQNPELTKYRRGRTEPEDLLKSLNKKYRAPFREFFPERREEIRKYIEFPKQRAKLEEGLSKLKTEHEVAREKYYEKRDANRWKAATKAGGYLGGYELIKFLGKD